jgi:hypothetical protein
MTKDPDIAANDTGWLLILKRTGKVLLIILRMIVNPPNHILIFYQYNISMPFSRGRLPY